MALDNKGQRLFLSAQDNHSVEILDIKNNKPIRSLPGFDEPKWIVYRPESNRLYVATGNDGKVTVLDATTYSTVKPRISDRLVNESELYKTALNL